MQHSTGSRHKSLMRMLEVALVLGHFVVPDELLEGMLLLTPLKTIVY